MRVAPMRQVMIGREMWDLRADHSAWYTIEIITKRSYRRIVRRLFGVKSQRLEPLYLLLWALSSSYRVEQRIQILEVDEDKRLGTKVPLQFVRQIDASIEGIDEMRRTVTDLLIETQLATLTKGDKQSSEVAQNPPIPPPSIGGGESLTPSPAD